MAFVAIFLGVALLFSLALYFDLRKELSDLRGRLSRIHKEEREPIQEAKKLAYCLAGQLCFKGEAFDSFCDFYTGHRHHSRMYKAGNELAFSLSLLRRAKGTEVARVELRIEWALRDFVEQCDWLLGVSEQ